jgi:hypothetical protein
MCTEHDYSILFCSADFGIPQVKSPKNNSILKTLFIYTDIQLMCHLLQNAENKHVMYLQYLMDNGCTLWSYFQTEME